MLKAEIAILELLKGAKTQKEIAQRLGISLSTVNNAMEPLERIGAIEKKKFGLKLSDKEKALTYWASIRNLQKDIIYATRSGLPVGKIEKNMPSGIAFTAYTAFRLRHAQVPADYSEVYVYAEHGELEEIEKRFPLQKGPPNILVLKKEKHMDWQIAPDELVFVDLWNLKEWYAKEFLRALRQKMGLET